MGRSTPAAVIGVVVVRAWHEGEGFRARVTSTSDIGTHDEEVRYFDSKTEVEEILRLWLDSF